MTSLKEIFAYNLKKNRQKNGLSQAMLAEKVNVSTHHIAMIEIAQNYPAMELVERIANTLNIEFYELFINHLSPQEEMERLYETVAKDIEQIVSETVNKVLAEKISGKVFMHEKQ